MAVKWKVIAKHPNGDTTSVNLFTDAGKDDTVAALRRIGCEVTIVDLTKLAEDYPRIPTPLEVEHEQWLIAAERDMDNFDDLQIEKRVGA